jgi:hypothetical protein
VRRSPDNDIASVTTGRAGSGGEYDDGQGAGCCLVGVGLGDGLAEAVAVTVGVGVALLGGDVGPA